MCNPQRGNFGESTDQYIKGPSPQDKESVASEFVKEHVLLSSGVYGIIIIIITVTQDSFFKNRKGGVIILNLLIQ